MHRTPTKEEVIAGHQEAWEAYDMAQYEQIIEECPCEWRLASVPAAGVS
jgi:hypothetical protein